MALHIPFALLICGMGSLRAAEVPAPKFRAVEIDSTVQIGYGVAVADVDGDQKPDILLADKKQVVWYRNPSWTKSVMAQDLTPLDNVCIAAADIDGDGKAEVAVGAQWNPADTVDSGAVFYLIPPRDRTAKWEPIRLPHEPTVHRMRWMRMTPSTYELIVVPLHGRGNKDGQGAGVRILSYKKPADPRQEWSTELINDALHMTHNLDLPGWSGTAMPELLIAGREGIFLCQRRPERWTSRPLTGARPGEPALNGAGEVRSGKLPGGRRFLAAVEPMHGSQLVVYAAPEGAGTDGLWGRQVVDDSLKEGHALACGDLLGAGSDQVVVGWRGKNSRGKVGIKLLTASDAAGQQWSPTILDDDMMACEDLCLADLNSDRKPDIVAAGRATRNLKIYWNESVSGPRGK